MKKGIRFLQCVVVGVFFSQTVSAADFDPDPVIPPWLGLINVMPQDGNGWTILTPAPDSRLHYVSSSEGNDGTGQFYLPSDPQIGSDPKNPVGPINAFATHAGAYAASRSNQPDWILFKRGDVWYTEGSAPVGPKQGRAENERFVITSYGTGDRPLFLSGLGDGLVLWQVGNVVVTDLHFIAHTRIPTSPDFAGWGNMGPGRSGILVQGGGFIVENILLENNIAEFFGGGALDFNNLVLRRNVIRHAYTDVGLAIGFFTGGDLILMEENVFDHNGWWQENQSNDRGNAQFGYAINQSHNNYFVTEQAIVRRNIVSRASSLNLKFINDQFTVDDTTNRRDVLIDNNLIIEGELGISIGGNSDFNNGTRFGNIIIENNVLNAIGRTSPTAPGPTVAWGIVVDDWDGGSVSGNLFLDFPEGAGLAVSVRGHSRDVVISDNTSVGIVSFPGIPMFGFESTDLRNILFQNNRIHVSDSGIYPITVSPDVLPHVTQLDNRYELDSPSTTFFSGAYFFNDWVVQSGETGSVTTFDFYERDRSIESYQTLHGDTPTLEGFLTSAISFTRESWDDRYTAREVNRYLRHGMCEADCGQPEEPTSVNVVANN